ncbi:hypothetical protein RFI_06678 [Reticulomyxa filosa]|uniref:HD/PDEase domain-containing protein n=1 Tax=Reticulomyxa filosa TaxID=46433 RepID=X6NYU7_RETFI|nr:hypothetical protein RFI_06678 [Reticulomyxa filosa]|eukprot:ETO30442.1 hypothetical protein RFI_06678 [Reticulomyxa filosa]
MSERKVEDVSTLSRKRNLSDSHKDDTHDHSNGSEESKQTQSKKIKKSEDCCNFSWNLIDKHSNMVCVHFKIICIQNVIVVFECKCLDITKIINGSRCTYAYIELKHKIFVWLRIVKKSMSKYDGSHDYNHILRVRKLALYIGTCEKMDDEQLKLIELCALLHDVFDHKYNESKKEKSEDLNNILVKYGISQEYIKKIEEIIDYVSYSKEQKHKKDPVQHSEYIKFLENNPVIKCVQDADRLDAIGAIGIGRTFCFSGSRNTSMFNYVNEQDTTMSVDTWTNSGKAKDTTIGHFFDKLLLLKDLMKTDTAKRLAKPRHDFLVAFVQNFINEWTC